MATQRRKSYRFSTLSDALSRGFRYVADGERDTGKYAPFKHEYCGYIIWAGYGGFIVRAAGHDEYGDQYEKAERLAAATEDYDTYRGDVLLQELDYVSLRDDRNKRGTIGAYADMVSPETWESVVRKGRELVDRVNKGQKSE